ncbi:glycosyltransferase, partial [Streptomyces sp. NPDC127074]|uniref:glycosyltransferase n=1 Tax=Streptomyces sp. NPDC127074 TaxID=3347130 RepID=UPI00366979EB
AALVRAPGPAETVGLAALVALACGSPVVVSALSALPDIVGAAGDTAADNGTAFADAVERVLGRSEPLRRAAARARAERYGWPAAVASFLTAHEASTEGVRCADGGGVPAAALPAATVVSAHRAVGGVR